jgi:cytochrome c biogenesis protein CcdA/thiol-disulfide isomerase/thioredoxin
MILLILAYAGGVLTIVSPCILPVLPFVLARADRSFLRNGLPLLLGMALAFTAVASLAAVGGGWAVQANEYGRIAALVLLVVFALTMLLPGLAERLTRPFVALGARLSESTDAGGAGMRSFASSLLLGLATGLLWAPCAGPVLGLILTGAALQGANLASSLLLLSYAGGAATSLAVSMLAGGHIFALLKRSLGVSQWVRRGLGAAVLAGVALIVTGVDTGLLSQVSLDRTSRFEQNLVETLTMKRTDQPMANVTPATSTMPTIPTIRTVPATSVTPRSPSFLRTAFNTVSTRELPPFDGAAGWINSLPLKSQDLRGKVVLVDFWTYSCINCLRTLPYVRAWADKYRDAGLVVIGVHSPEFAFEKNPDHVRRAVKDLNITYPVAVDSNLTIWRAFRNQYWPALYFVDAQGRLRHHVFGEGQYQESERVIQQLLAENGKAPGPVGLVAVQGSGVQAAAGNEVLSEETYVGYQRASDFAPASGLTADLTRRYEPSAALKLNQWTLGGEWMVEAERAVSAGAGAHLAYRFRARDLHLVLGRDGGGGPIRFRVLVDGKPPLTSHGTDINPDGKGIVDANRLYQLVRLQSAGEHLFEIEFLDPGAQVYVFTFG